MLVIPLEHSIYKRYCDLICVIFIFRETKVTSPQKKVLEEEKVVQEEVDEDSKASENGDTKETKENGSSEEKEIDEKEAESTENGDSTGIIYCYLNLSYFAKKCMIEIYFYSSFQMLLSIAVA